MTDVTFKAVKTDYYLCSSVVYSPDLKKNIGFFQATIKHQATEQFSVYFQAMFKKFAINPDDFLGVLMDFSQSQREGFIDACQTAFGFTQARSLSYLKGCFMHWMQSVQRIKNAVKL
jgi:hypothetical protein